MGFAICDGMHLFIDASRANAKEPTGVEEYAFHVIEELKKIAPPEWHVTLFSREPLQGGLSVLPPNWESRVLCWRPKRLWTQVRLSAAIARIRAHSPSPHQSFDGASQPSPAEGRGSGYLTSPLSAEERETNIRYPKSNILFIPAHVLPLVHLPNTAVTIHDVGALRFPHTYSAFERWYVRWSTAFALRHGAHILVPSEFTKKEILSLFCHPGPSLLRRGIEDRIHVVPLAYDAARYHANLDPGKTAQVIARYGITKPYFYFQGRIEEKKNVARLVEALGHLFRGSTSAPRVSLVLAGKPGYGCEKVKAAIDASSAKSQIKLLGYVPPEDAPYLMAGATAFVFPSLYEGFGIPVLEAMAVGTPVVCSRAGSLPEVGGDAALYFDSHVEATAAALTSIVSDQSLRERLRTRGFERVQQFSWAHTAGQTLKIFRSLS